MHFILLALLLAAAMGGGTSVAAQSALPGDTLWGFKVGINEAFGAALAAGEKAQAKFDIKVLEARIRETVLLAQDARLNAEAKTSLEESFERHSARIKEAIAALQEKGEYEAAAEIAARFQAVVATGASVLAEQKVSNSADLSSFIDTVREALDTASELSAEASAEVNNDN
jgi:hypothetical protein